MITWCLVAQKALRKYLLLPQTLLALLGKLELAVPCRFPQASASPPWAHHLSAACSFLAWSAGAWGQDDASFWVSLLQPCDQKMAVTEKKNHLKVLVYEHSLSSLRAVYTVLFK